MLAQAEVNALLIAGRIDDACATIESYSASYDEMFWLKAAAMCALHANDPTSAAFSVDLVREMDGESDATFFGLVAAIRSGTAVNADLLTDLRPIDIALLSIAKQSIPESQLETGNAVSIIGLTNAAATPTDVRLEAAHKAENLGLISAQQLGDIYSVSTQNFIRLLPKAMCLPYVQKYSQPFLKQPRSKAISFRPRGFARHWWKKSR